MKKIVLSGVIALSVISCNKADIQQTKDAIKTADSAAAIVNESVKEVQDFRNKIGKAKDSLQGEISKNNKVDIIAQENENIQKKLKEGLVIIDSVSENLSKIEKVVQPKETSGTKIIVEKPIIVKETQVKVKEVPEKNIIPQSLVKKRGSIEIMVDDLQSAKEVAKYEISKFDGKIVAEKMSREDESENQYIRVKVPVQKFDFLIEQLEMQLGKVQNKNLDIEGSFYKENTPCDLEINLIGQNKKAEIFAKEDSFINQSLAAMGSGWEVMKNIFLFFLPFWPLALIGGGIYFWQRKKISTHPKNTD